MRVVWGGGGVYGLLYTLHEKWNGEFNIQEEKFLHFTLNGKQGVVAKLFFPALIPIKQSCLNTKIVQFRKVSYRVIRRCSEHKPKEFPIVYIQTLYKEH